MHLAPSEMAGGFFPPPLPEGDGPARTAEPGTITLKAPSHLSWGLVRVHLIVGPTIGGIVKLGHLLPVPLVEVGGAIEVIVDGHIIAELTVALQVVGLGCFVEPGVSGLLCT